MYPKIIILIFVVCLTACPALDTLGVATYEIDGIRIIDGDTAEVLIVGQGSQRVRLLGVDAPESRQAFGKASKKSLATCTTARPLQLASNKTDRYGRLVGVIYAGGIDCNLYQIQSGMAWHYKAYQNDQTKTDQQKYANAEQYAQTQKIGLWSDNCPIAPWNYRKGQKSCGLGVSD